MTIDAEQVRAGQRKMWSTGDWPRIAETIQPVADALIERAGVGEGQDVLDVGAGSGNVAVPAAGRGARVTAADITPELMEMGRARAAGEGVEVEWVEGDAGALPFAASRSTSCSRSSAACSRPITVRPPPSLSGCAGLAAPSACARGRRTDCTGSC